MSESEEDDFLSADEGGSDKEDNPSTESDEDKIKNTVKQSSTSDVSERSNEEVKENNPERECNIKVKENKNKSNVKVKENKPDSTDIVNIKENKPESTDIVKVKENKPESKSNIKDKEKRENQSNEIVKENENNEIETTIEVKKNKKLEKPIKETKIRNISPTNELKEETIEDKLSNLNLNIQKEVTTTKDSDSTNEQSTESLNTEKDTEVNVEIIKKPSFSSITNVTENKTEVIPRDAPPETENPLNKTCTDENKTKPTKVSKIGMKKPRERLGERLGNKKLGSRMTNPLVGISSDSIQQNKEQQNSPELEQITKDSKIEKSNPQLAEKSLPQTSKDPVIESDSSWSSWGDWGSTFITAASTLSKEVTRGVGTVLETVESGIGAPDPIELAKEMVEMEKKKKEEEEEEEKEDQQGKREMQKEPGIVDDQANYGFGLGALGSLVSGVLETASNKVLYGGLDTLEKIGRKTMDIIQEGDPGLRRKRNFLRHNNQNLAMVLREARERAIAEEEERSVIGPGSREGQVCMALVWDNTEGPIHLEALSLVAKQCQEKTNSLLKELTPVWHGDFQKTIRKIKSHCCIEDEHKEEDIPYALTTITREVKLPLQFNKILTGWPCLQDSLRRLSIEICGLGCQDLDSIQSDLYKDIAAFICAVAAVCHKTAEVVLTAEDVDGVGLASQFQRLCGCVSGGLERAADDVCDSMSKTLPATDPDFNRTMTNIYVQMAEANSYLETSLSDLNHVFVQAEANKILHQL